MSLAMISSFTGLKASVIEISHCCERAGPSYLMNIHLFLYVTAEDVKIHLKVLRDLYIRKTKPQAKKSGSGYKHLPVRKQHIIDRLKFLEPYRRVGSPPWPDWRNPTCSQWSQCSRKEGKPKAPHQNQSQGLTVPQGRTRDRR